VAKCAAATNRWYKEGTSGRRHERQLEVGWATDSPLNSPIQRGPRSDPLYAATNARGVEGTGDPTSTSAPGEPASHFNLCRAYLARRMRACATFTVDFVPTAANVYGARGGDGWLRREEAIRRGWVRRRRDGRSANTGGRVRRCQQGTQHARGHGERYDCSAYDESGSSRARNARGERRTHEHASAGRREHRWETGRARSRCRRMDSG
jgi:hypothetical protein